MTWEKALFTCSGSALHIFAHAQYETAQHDHKDMVRTAIVTQAEKLLAVILQPHSKIDEEEEVVFDIGGLLLDCHF